MDTNEEEQTMPQATPMSKIVSNGVNTTPLEIDFIQYIQSRVGQCHWNSQQLELKNQVNNRVDVNITELQLWVI
jgi:hypothetical protein